MTQVTVVDYGAGNLLSVVRALTHVGAEVLVTTRPDEIASAQRLVLPGVGAFADCMQALARLDLIDSLQTYLRSGRPYLGICVGMQVLFEVGEEFGEHAGLGALSGRVKRIPDTNAQGKTHKIPHIGWNPLIALPGVDLRGGMFSSLINRTRSMYFVHSYVAHPDIRDEVLAEVDYHGLRLCAAVHRGAIWGVQFHPEKSGEDGLELLRSFLVCPARK
jgi:glutamine amidotransferase